MKTADSSLPPLCVDLDDTLVASDTLWEGILTLLRRNPFLLFSMFLWLLRSKAYFKQQIAQQAQIDAQYLPYRADVMAFLRAEKAKGRYLVLATASNTQVADSVAAQVQLFDEIYASNEVLNLKGVHKRDALQKRFGEFDYMGDAYADLPILQVARKGYLVNPSRALRNAYPCPDEHIFGHTPTRNIVKAWLKALRPHQWAKNGLIFLPLMFSLQFVQWDKTLAVLLAFVAFSLTASAGYLINDLLDLAADRAHKTKKNRPFAAGVLPVQQGLPVFISLLVFSFGLTLCCLPLEFSAILLIYLISTLFYSFYLKRKLILDVLVLAGLYTLRIIAGGIAIGTTISDWLLAFSMFLFMSLAFLKRYVELLDLDETQNGVKNRDYFKNDAELVSSIGPANGYLAVLVLALYIEAIQKEHSIYQEIYRSPELLWFICPALLYWITRVWFLAHRHAMPDDPVKFALTDIVSWLILGYTTLLMLSAVYF